METSYDRQPSPGLRMPLARPKQSEANLDLVSSRQPEDRATAAHARLFAISKTGQYRSRSKEERADVIEG
jgi:hypothetical protein